MDEAHGCRVMPEIPRLLPSAPGFAWPLRRGARNDTRFGGHGRQNSRSIAFPRPNGFFWVDFGHHPDQNDAEKGRDMTEFKEFKPARLLMGRLGYGTDLLEELTAVCRKENVRLGSVTALGAVQKARIAFYDQVKREYRHEELNRRLEIAALVGNVSLKDGSPFIHAHVTLTDEKGKGFGGHLAPGTVVFACEFRIEAFDGPELNRVPDAETGLGLWEM
jgi:hypothetical protein